MNRTYNATLICTSPKGGTSHALVNVDETTRKVHAMGGHWSHLSWSPAFDEVFRSAMAVRLTDGVTGRIVVDGGASYYKALGLKTTTRGGSQAVISL